MSFRDDSILLSTYLPYGLRQPYGQGDQPGRDQG
jgi:hypothetical protein